MAEKTMNTLLHVFEAYTELYRVTKDPFTGDRLRFMMDLFANKVYNKEKGRQEVFFDRTWNTLIDLYSYGHDIETSWLIDRGTEDARRSGLPGKTAADHRRDCGK